MTDAPEFKQYGQFTSQVAKSDALNTTGTAGPGEAPAGGKPKDIPNVKVTPFDRNNPLLGIVLENNPQE